MFFFYINYFKHNEILISFFLRFIWETIGFFMWETIDLKYEIFTQI